eukprot:4898755-Pyramimonas_sp.AAC.1
MRGDDLASGADVVVLRSQLQRFLNRGEFDFAGRGSPLQLVANGLAGASLPDGIWSLASARVAGAPRGPFPSS